MTPNMTRTLAEVVDNMSAAERRATVTALAEYIARLTPRSTMARLLRGVRSELLAAEMREDAVLAALEADGYAEHRAETDALDVRLHGEPPPVEGEPYWPEGHGG